MPGHYVSMAAIIELRGPVVLRYTLPARHYVEYTKVAPIQLEFPMLCWEDTGKRYRMDHDELVAWAQRAPIHWHGLC